MSSALLADPTGVFRPLPAAPERLSVEPRDAAHSYRRFQARDGFEVHLPEELVVRLRAWSRKAAPNEWFGLLVGRAGRDVRGAYVVLLGAVIDSAAIASPAFIRTTADSEFRTRSLARTLYPNAVILGPVHGHVGCGAQYSGTDRDNQSTWTKPYSIGIVVDPWSTPEIGVYRGPECEHLSPSSDQAADVLIADRPKSPPTAPLPAPRHWSSIGLVVVALLTSLSIALAAIALWSTARLDNRIARIRPAISNTSRALVSAPATLAPLTPLSAPSCEFPGGEDDLLFSRRAGMEKEQ